MGFILFKINPIVQIRGVHPNIFMPFIFPSNVLKSIFCDDRTAFTGESHRLLFCYLEYFRDFSRFSEECLVFAVVGFERVTFRPSVRPSGVTKTLVLRALDRVRAPPPRP